MQLKAEAHDSVCSVHGRRRGVGGLGEYVEAHKNELDKISGILVHDTGTGRVLTLGLHDNYQDREIVDQEIAPLRELKLLEPTMQRSFGTDHASFDDAGVPGFFAVQDFAEYSKTHHSQSDTFDKVWKDDLNQGAQVLAAWAYTTAQLPEMLPRRQRSDMKRPEAGDCRNSTRRDRSTSEPKPDPSETWTRKFWTQVKADESELKANLQYLTDHIGPRLTGSPQLEQASQWTMEQFKRSGWTTCTRSRGRSRIDGRAGRRQDECFLSGEQNRRRAGGC